MKNVIELTESIPLRSKKAVGPFSFSIANMLVNSSEKCCCWDPNFSLRSRANILRISFPDMLCPPITWINWAIFKTILSLFSSENQSSRKLSIPALTQDARFDSESFSNWRKTFSPWCRNESLLCPIYQMTRLIIQSEFKHYLEKIKKSHSNWSRTKSNQPSAEHLDTARSHLHSEWKRTKTM